MVLDASFKIMFSNSGFISKDIDIDDSTALFMLYSNMHKIKLKKLLV